MFAGAVRMSTMFVSAVPMRVVAFGELDLGAMVVALMRHNDRRYELMRLGDIGRRLEKVSGRTKSECLSFPVTSFSDHLHRFRSGRGFRLSLRCNKIKTENRRHSHLKHAEFDETRIPRQEGPAMRSILRTHTVVDYTPISH